ncbi:MAG: 2-dehydro-3-deoxy-6-phosphogalactonate aldolase [Hyphomicrobiales bacterium]
MNRNIIAILRGVTPKEVIAVGEAILDAGISNIEVPLNSPQAFESVELLASAFSDEALIGAGTVLTTAEVRTVRSAGGEFVVSPNCDVDVIAETEAQGMLSFPGVFTASECFTALKAGANGLKIFPAFQMGPEGLKALRAVLPPEAPVYAVGGVGPDDFNIWMEAGADGFGIGTSLYRPAKGAEDVGRSAKEIVEAFDKAAKQNS